MLEIAVRASTAVGYLPAAMSRTRQPVPWRFVATGLIATTALLVVVVVYGYVRFVRYDRVAITHLPADTTAAIVVQVEHVKLFDPMRKHLIPLIDDIDKKPGAGRLDRLRKQGLNLGFDLREVAAARGQRWQDWVVVLSGKFPRTGAVGMVAGVLHDDGAGWKLSEDRGTLVAPSGAALGQADDGSLVLASSAQELAAALPSGDGWRQLGMTNDSAASFYVSGALARDVARAGGAPDPGELDAVVGRVVLGRDAIEGTIQVGLPAGADAGKVQGALRAVLAALGKSPIAGSTGQREALQKAMVSVAGKGIEIRTTWQPADLMMAAGVVGNSIRGWTGTPLPRAGPANP